MIQEYEKTKDEEIRTTEPFKGITLRISAYNGGLHWLYVSKKESLSIICHNGSYGNEEGLFETMCSWKPDVQGFLTFGQVQRKINTLIRRSK